MALHPTSNHPSPLPKAPNSPKSAQFVFFAAIASFFIYKSPPNTNSPIQITTTEVVARKKVTMWGRERGGEGWGEDGKGLPSRVDWNWNGLLDYLLDYAAHNNCSSLLGRIPDYSRTAQEGVLRCILPERKLFEAGERSRGNIGHHEGSVSIAPDRFLMGEDGDGRAGVRGEERREL